jgi:hypothetical protein
MMRTVPPSTIGGQGAGPTAVGVVEEDVRVFSCIYIYVVWLGCWQALGHWEALGRGYGG